MTWTNGWNWQAFEVGQRVAIPERGQGVIVEVLPTAQDCDGNWRVPYRVKLDCGGIFMAHPDNMRVVEAVPA